MALLIIRFPPSFLVGRGARFEALPFELWSNVVTHILSDPLDFNLPFPYQPLPTTIIYRRQHMGAELWHGWTKTPRPENPRTGHVNLLLVSKTFQQLAIPQFYSFVYVNQQNIHSSYRCKIKQLRETLESTADADPSGGGYGRHIRRLVIDMKRCNQSEFFKVMARCPLLSILVVDLGHRWTDLSPSIHAFPSTLTRFEFYPYYGHNSGSYQVDFEWLSPFLNNQPNITSLSFPDLSRTIGPIILHHIASIELSLNLPDKTAILNLTLPSLTRLTLSGSLHHVENFAIKFGHNLTYLSLESWRPQRVLSSMKSFFLHSPQLRDVVCHIPRGEEDEQLTFEGVPAHDGIQELALRVNRPTCVPLLLSQAARRMDWPSLRCIRLDRETDYRVDPRHEVQLSEETKENLQTRCIALEDWRGLSLLSGRWSLDASAASDVRNPKLLPMDTTMFTQSS